jgi:prepilin-type N-terminal cleavage/methylation domain-containing protein
MLDSLPSAGPTRPLPNAILTNFAGKIQRLTKKFRRLDFCPDFRDNEYRAGALIARGGMVKKRFISDRFEHNRHSQRNCSMRRLKSGFTLVELLVVITIIGLLIALLIPAVNTIRERGRQAVCMNNEKELATAILTYETSQRQLPGLMNQITITGGTTQVQFSWTEAILPNLEHADIWGYIASGNTKAVAGIRVSTTICPDDPLSADPTSAKAQMLLSYGVNDQFFVDWRGKPFNTNANLTPPIGRSALASSAGSFYSAAAPVLSNLKTQPYTSPSATYLHGQSVTATQTIMLAERTFIDTTSYSNQRAGQWGDPATTNPPSPSGWANWTSTPQKFWQALAFPNPVLPRPIPSPAISQQYIASTHGATSGKPGTVVVVTYFDGSGAILPSETPFP